MSSIASFGDSFEAQELMMLLSISFISLRLPVVLILRLSWFPSEALATCSCLGIVFKLSILVLELWATVRIILVIRRTLLRFIEHLFCILETQIRMVLFLSLVLYNFNKMILGGYNFSLCLGFLILELLWIDQVRLLAIFLRWLLSGRIPNMPCFASSWRSLLPLVDNFIVVKWCLNQFIFVGIRQRPDVILIFSIYLRWILM